jgi:DNA helicase HerA-like ATPase
VGCPPGQDATSEAFHFWIPPSELVEKTQLVTCSMPVPGIEKELTFYALIDEVHRTSRKKNMAQEFDEADGDTAYEPPFETEGCTWAQASILRTEPPLLTPPHERTMVKLATLEDAKMAYRADEIKEHRSLPVGLIKNGGSQWLGPGFIDLDYLLGVNGGHMNVNGAAGRGTKSSFLLYVNWMLLRHAREAKRRAPSSEDRPRIVPIILNVKGHDLFYIDRPNKYFSNDPAKHAKYLQQWNEIGVEEPKPFEKVSFFAVQQAGSTLPVRVAGREDVTPFSWSLKNIIEEGLLLYLFSDEDAGQVNFSALVHDISDLLTSEVIHNDGSLTRQLNIKPLEQWGGTFQGLLEFVKIEGGNKLQNHAAGTWKKLYRRLLNLLHESKGVLRRNDVDGKPLKVTRAETCDPLVIDLTEISSVELQRFVVATILRQLVESRTGSNRQKGLVYCVTLDELNRFAPAGSRDPITMLIEQVAAEMRSQGIILFGAQQQASMVSRRVVENCAIRAMGKSGSQELQQSVWGFLSSAARRKAENLLPDEKLIAQDNFREPMHVTVPFPAWAVNPDEAESPHTARFERLVNEGEAINGTSGNGAASGTVKFDVG